MCKGNEFLTGCVLKFIETTACDNNDPMAVDIAPERSVQQGFISMVIHNLNTQYTKVIAILCWNMGNILKLVIFNTLQP